MHLLDQVLKILKPYLHFQNFYIAYSGGLDSTVLLHLFYVLSQNQCTFPKLKALHVNHSIHSDADDWVKHCQAQCKDFDIPLEIIKVNAKAGLGQSQEALARQYRYQAFREYIQPGSALVTAHHEEDQAETVLLQLVRGAGVAGLSAMPISKDFAHGVLLRPLLLSAKKDILDYAETQKLIYVHDSSNESLQYDRNFLRLCIMPLLKKRWPSVARTISRVASNCADTLNLLKEFKVAAKAHADDAMIKTQTSVIIDSYFLQKHSVLLQYEYLKTYLLQAAKYLCPNLPNEKSIPSRRLLEQIWNEIIHSRIDSQAVIKWHSLEIRKFKNQIFIQQAARKPSMILKKIWNPLLQPTLSYPEIGLCLSAHIRQDIGLCMGKNLNLEIRFRQGGEKILLHRKHKSLKKLFNEWEIPPWQRDQIPLVFSEGECIAIVNYAIADHWQVRKGEQGLLICSEVNSKLQSGA